MTAGRKSKWYAGLTSAVRVPRSFLPSVLALVQELDDFARLSAAAENSAPARSTSSISFPLPSAENSAPARSTSPLPSAENSAL